MFESSAIVGYPMGACPKHGHSIVAVNGVPTCIKCSEDEAKARAVPFAVVEDRSVSERDLDVATKGFTPKEEEKEEVLDTPNNFNGHLKRALVALKSAQGQVDDLKVLKKIIKLRDQIKVLIEE